MTVPADLWLWLLAVTLIIVGIAGTVLPALPGPPLVFGGLLLAAWIEGFQKVGAAALTVLGVLTLLAVVIDLLAGIYGAKRVGASRSALIGASIGTLLGVFLGLPGLIFGPFAGALAGEFLSRRNALAAGRVAFGTWLGLLLAVAIKLALVFAILGLFLLAYLF